MYFKNTIAHLRFKIFYLSYWSLFCHNSVTVVCTLAVHWKVFMEVIILFYTFPHVLHHLLCQHLELMDWAMWLREPLNVTILNQAEVKYYELLVVLFRNPFIDAMESKKKKKNVGFNEDEDPVIHYVLHGLPCVTLQMQFFDKCSWLHINTHSLPLSIA